MALHFKRANLSIDRIAGLVRTADSAVDLRNPHPEPKVPDRVKFSAERAAVGLLIVDKAKPTMIFTRRHPSIRFGNQYCFPGGKVDATDASIEQTVLREIREEIDLTASRYEIIGRLGQYYTQSGFCITPFVGIVAADYTVALNPAEVSGLKEIPLIDVLDPDQYQLMKWGGNRAHYHFRLKDFDVSGPTVSMMINFSEVVSPCLS
ncbi:MAG: CoA pyrophosphatase [Gammaproteobacteria bacterium]|nr:CoA pyrophosphatase [Gammaproteobacteria bacterium]